MHRSGKDTDVPETANLVKGETTGTGGGTFVVTVIFLATVLPPLTVTVSVALMVWSFAAASTDRTGGKRPTVA
jgi:hypothetical protein